MRGGVGGDDTRVAAGRGPWGPAATAAAGDSIPTLEAELKLLGQRSAVLAANQAEQQAVTIMADRQMPYSLLRKLMVSCARANFADVSFAVRKKEV